MKILNEQAGGDGSAKFLAELDDGNTVEALYMHDATESLTFRSTACVSSQVGCAVGCRFCATGAQGFVRDLDAAEITGQVRLIDAYRERGGLPPLDAVVFAGMGEPLFNFENVTEAIARLASDGLRDFELATAGVAPGILKLAGFVGSAGVRVRLNVSLHAATDEKRAGLIPLTRRYGIADILAAAEEYALATRTKTRVRYMLLKGYNDTDEDAALLAGLLRGRSLKLVISSYNDNTISGLTPPEPLDVLEFYNKIKRDVDCDIFRNFGSSVLGGCGQLRRAVRHEPQKRIS